MFEKITQIENVILVAFLWSFKESCSDKVGEVMRAHALERRAVYEKRKESADKEYRLRYTEEKLPFIFPGLS